ncbi:hypothetical protein C6502_06065 [Candidatus Poribacteria bacterium]|nr:MAG: hypothetical protein C6502_06065 [Candidatus Poribacteria bacterium]
MHQELTYKLAQCCSPKAGEDIIGYFKEDGTVTVHRSDCASVQQLRLERLLEVTWSEIHAAEKTTDIETEDSTFNKLDDVDYLILKHHQEYGLDYSIVVSEMLGLPLEETYDHHRKLRELGGLKRVEKRMIQYRKNIVKGKWIKHRNHTYYELTPKGDRWIHSFEAKTETVSSQNKGVKRDA